MGFYEVGCSTPCNKTKCTTESKFSLLCSIVWDVVEILKKNGRSTSDNKLHIAIPWRRKQAVERPTYSVRVFVRRVSGGSPVDHASAARKEQRTLCRDPVSRRVTQCLPYVSHGCRVTPCTYCVNKGVTVCDTMCVSQFCVCRDTMIWQKHSASWTTCHDTAYPVTHRVTLS